MHHFWWCHVPNGGARTKAEAGIFKALGVMAGVADILIIPQGGKSHWVEIKPKGRYQSESQRAFEGVMIALGCPYRVVRGVDEVDAALREWGVISPLTTRQMDEVA